MQRSSYIPSEDFTDHEKSFISIGLFKACSVVLSVREDLDTGRMTANELWDMLYLEAKRTQGVRREEKEDKHARADFGFA